MTGFMEELEETADDALAGDEQRAANELLAEIVDLLRQQQGLETGTRYYTPGVSTAALDSATTEDSRADRVHFGEQVSVSASDTKSDPRRVDLPFKAHLLDVRNLSETLYVAARDPTNAADDSVWFEVSAAEAPVSELPVATGELYLATDTGVSDSPRIDAWLHGL